MVNFGQVFFFIKIINQYKLIYGMAPFETKIIDQ